MLAMTSVIVKTCFYLLSNFLYSTGRPPNVAMPAQGNSPTLLLDGPGCVNQCFEN